MEGLQALDGQVGGEQEGGRARAGWLRGEVGPRWAMALSREEGEAAALLSRGRRGERAGRCSRPRARSPPPTHAERRSLAAALLAAGLGRPCALTRPVQGRLG